MGSGGWPKESKLLMEVRVATTCSVAEYDFNSLNDSCSDVVGNGLGGIDFEGDGDEHKVQIFDKHDDEEQNLWREFLVRNEEENVEGSVRKSKGFLPMSLSNPKGESFDAKRINFGGGGRSKAAGLKKR